ncbi:MAG: flagellar hook protein FlgE [Candidatus Eisenbacteria bacterium]|uniref:Flagellar hook protein FlgE n=1 Tax=Eiseniibacteriota bacterium TaxID=2212470 RepID=A0A956SCJ8_UNCEI|nr:flagellar hook protein FlgE [Candidatus Eisenbacteria bacterium]
MLRSLFSGVTGLGTNTLRMDVIGNNVANVNTVGFKSTRITFEEQVAQTLRGATGPQGSAGGSNPMQIGNGSRVASLDSVFTQGGLEATGVATDLAIQGNAFFVLSNGSRNFFTRAGSFQIDGAGQLVNPSNGYTLQGFAFDRASGTYGAQPTTLTVPIGEAEPARATTVINYRGNLEADSEPRGSEAQSGIFFAADGSLALGTTALTDLRADSTGVVSLLQDGDEVRFSATVGKTAIDGSFAVTGGATLDQLATQIETTLNSVDGVDGITVSVNANGRLEVISPDILGTDGAVNGLIIQGLDSEGLTRDDFNSIAGLTETDTARDAGVFVEETTVYDSLGFAHVVRLEFTRVLETNQFTWTAEVDGGSTDVLIGGSGRVTFNTDGSLSGFAFDLQDGILPNKLTLGPTTGAASPLEIDLNAGTIGGFDGITLLEASSSLEATQDGFTQGSLVDFRIDRDGTLITLFSNGVTRPIGRVALAEFVNEGGLARAGDNLFEASVNSGDALISSVAGGVEASVFSGSLEQSNVDLAREFTNMILAQRGFQASARVITTSDEVLSELLNIKR